MPIAPNMDREALKNMTELRTESYSDWIGMMSSDESMMILELVVVGVELLPGVVAVSLSADPPLKSNRSNTKKRWTKKARKEKKKSMKKRPAHHLSEKHSTMITVEGTKINNKV